MQSSVIIWVLLAFVAVSGQNLEPFAKEIGGTFCKYLAYKSVLPRKYFSECGDQTCTWDDWSAASKTHGTNRQGKVRYVVSYAHNGFGNQLWEHSVAFMIAESLKAQLLIATIPDSLSPGGAIPPNTWSGMNAMERLLPPQFLYENLPPDSPVRVLCDAESFYLADRPVDWRDKNYTENFRPNLLNILSDNKPRCLKFLGYFQNLPLCADDARRLWTSKLVANFTVKPGPNDVSIYLRCIPRHYHFNDVKFYDTILSHTTFDRVWMFQAPECPNKLSDNPAKDGVVAAVVRLLTTKYNATKWPGYQGEDETNFLLHDLAGLTQSTKLILPVSSWAYWAGFLSNATEIHVNSPPHHSVMSGYPQYVYHNDKTQQYFGRYDAKENDIVYDDKYLKHPTVGGKAEPTAGLSAAGSAHGGSVAPIGATPPVPATPKETTAYIIHHDIV